MSSFFHWFLRLIKKWFWVLGFLPLAVDLLTTYVPEEYYRNQLQLILGNWFLTGLLFLVGFVASAYLVHIEDEREITKLSEKIGELENRQPILEVGFLDKRNDLDKNLQIHLSQIPDPPDYDELLREKQRELLDKQAKFLEKLELENQDVKIQFFPPFDKRINPNYESQVEDHLEKYRKHLIDLNNLRHRVVFIKPIVKNVGGHPATEITIELIMPERYQEPSEEQYLEFWLYYDHPNYTPRPPEEPSVTLRSLEDKIRDTSISMSSFQSDFLISTPQQDVFRPSNTDGPTHNEKNGRDLITYTVKTLVQQRSEEDFEPFILWLDGQNETTTWEIGVNVYCAEYINSPKTDTLHIDFIVDED